MNDDIFSLQESWNKLQETIDNNESTYFYLNKLIINKENKKLISSDKGEPSEEPSYDSPGYDGYASSKTFKVTLDITVNGGIDNSEVDSNEWKVSGDISSINISELFKTFCESNNSDDVTVKSELESHYGIDREMGDLLVNFKLNKIKNIKVNNIEDIIVNAIVECEITETERSELDEADKVTSPRKRMAISQVYTITGVNDEAATKKVIQDYMAANNVSEYVAVRNITEEIREFASATMNRCTKSLNLFRKVGPKKPSLDDHLNGITDQDIELNTPA